MNDSTSYVRLPHTLTSANPLTVASEPIDGDQFSARQIELVRHLFGYCAYLREHARTTPMSDAFLPVFVLLLEVLELNAPLEARQCVAQLSQVIRVTFPDLEVDTAQAMESAIAELKRSEA
ncbi:hypothetical protein PQR05_37610 [Paraburkholderia sediminicola]|uniref:hypothetical protein n=1 Tax=Paraburkholderia sediminicola TaxID=458836 RepID=UPI0038B6D6FF